MNYLFILYRYVLSTIMQICYEYCNPCNYRNILIEKFHIHNSMKIRHTIREYEEQTKNHSS